MFLVSKEGKLGYNNKNICAINSKTYRSQQTEIFQPRDLVINCIFPVSNV